MEQSSRATLGLSGCWQFSAQSGFRSLEGAPRARFYRGRKTKLTTCVHARVAGAQTDPTLIMRDLENVAALYNGADRETPTQDRS